MYLIVLVPCCILFVYLGDSLKLNKISLLIKKKKKVSKCGEIKFYSAFILRWALVVESNSGTIVGVGINL